MEYLFLKRKETSSTSQRQKNLLFKAAEKHWEEYPGDRTVFSVGHPAFGTVSEVCS